MTGPSTPGGPPARAPSVALHGAFAGPSSVAGVTRAWARHLPRLGVARPGLSSINGFDPADRDLAGRPPADPAAAIGIWYGFPDEVGTALAGNRFRVGAFVCETDRITADWVTAANRLDLVVVPSTFCADAFRASGVTRDLLVVPHGLDAAFAPSPEPSAQVAARTGPLRFLHSFAASSSATRKGAEELVAAFLATFGHTGSEAVLVLRTEIGVMRDLALQHKLGDAVHWLPPVPVPVTEIADLYRSFDVVAHPTRGEGFGLVPLEAQACGVPVVTSFHTGLVDHVDPTVAITVGPGPPVAGERRGNAAGNYFAVDTGAWAEALRQAADTHEGHRARTRASAKNLRSRYAWPAVLAGLAERLVSQPTDR